MLVHVCVHAVARVWRSEGQPAGVIVLPCGFWESNSGLGSKHLQASETFHQFSSF